MSSSSRILDGAAVAAALRAEAAARAAALPPRGIRPVAPPPSFLVRIGPAQGDGPPQPRRFRGRDPRPAPSSETRRGGTCPRSGRSDEGRGRLPPPDRGEAPP